MSIETPQPNEPQPSEPQQSQEKKQNPVLIGVLIVAIIALVLAIFWVVRGNNGGGDTGEEIILPPATVIPATPVPGEATAIVTAPDGVNIRSGPGTEYDVIGIMPYNTQAPIIGRSADGQWWVLNIPAAPNSQGWVAASYVRAENAGNAPVILPPGAPAPEPTATPVLPVETPVVTILFDADSKSINEGDCTTLRWKVENVKEVYVYPVGEPWEDYPKAGAGDEEVCPTSTTTYEMRVVLQDNTVQLSQVTVEVKAGNPLAVTNWSLVSMNVNQGLVPDTAITASFNAAGEVSGDAGCNTYNGVYTVKGDTLTIGPLTTSRLVCDDPVSSQETAYLTALQSASTFAISGSQLVIYDARNQEILRYNSAPLDR
jgi:heat shock protein HslJ